MERYAKKQMTNFHGEYMGIPYKTIITSLYTWNFPNQILQNAQNLEQSIEKYEENVNQRAHITSAPGWAILIFVTDYRKVYYFLLTLTSM